MNITFDHWGQYKSLDMPGTYTISGVKKRGIDKHGNEFFESCEHNSPEAIGWTVSYDGVVWCGVIFSSPKEVQAVVQTMAGMFNQGLRYNQLKVKQVLGIP